MFRASGSADIDSSDLFIVVGLNPSQWERVLPALDASIRRRLQRGAKLIVINSKDTKLSDVATISIKKDEVEAIRSIIKALMEKGLKASKGIASLVSDAEVTEDSQKAADIIMASNSPVVFSSPNLFGVSANLASFKGTAIAVPLESNARGVALMGLEGDISYKDMVSGAVKVLYAVGEVPLSKRPDVEFLIVQNSHLTGLAKEADVVLPSATYLEIEGTMVDYMGRLRHLIKAVEPQGEAKSHGEIFISISDALGLKIKRPTLTEVKKALKTKPKAETYPFEKKSGFDISPDEFIESINASVINGSRLLWLKETERAISA
jgi:predicted molibdopterin-dependent oxidoreductase YjgC